MSQEESSVTRRLEELNENGRVYLWVGILSAFLSLVIFPLAGPVSIVCGYKLHVDEDQTLQGGLIATAGAVGFLFWVGLLLTGGPPS
jgi:nitrate reductase NapE component